MSDQIRTATRDAYGKALVELGDKNKNIVVLDADLAEATAAKDALEARLAARRALPRPGSRCSLRRSRCSPPAERLSRCATP